MYSWPVDIQRDVVHVQHNGGSIRAYCNCPESIPATLVKAATERPHHVAIVSDAVRLTYHQLYTRVCALAHHMHQRLGLTPGQRFAIVQRNTVEFCLGVYAALMAGLIVVPLNTKLQPREIATQMNDAGVKAVLVTEQKDFDSLKPFLNSGMQVLNASQLWNIDGSLEPKILRQFHPNVHDPAFIMYTSGTTGNPKGVVLTHFNALHGAMNYEKCYGLTQADTTLVAVPIFHATGLIAQLVTFIYLGGTVALLETFDPERMLVLSEREAITHTICVPTIYNFLIDVCEQKHFRLKYRHLAIGGAPVSQTLYRRIQEWLPDAELLNTYGLTEATSPALMTPPEMSKHKVGAVGVASPIIECKIIDLDDGRVLPSGQPGEILLRGALVCDGYWNNPEQTRIAIDDGWLRTGDVGYMDSDGFVYICDRIKNMINRGGEKVYSVEVEDILSLHPEVFECAVVGVPDEIYGERVKAYVVPRKGCSPSEADLINWVRQRLARYKTPEAIEFVGAITRNAGGKVDKKCLINSTISE